MSKKIFTVGHSTHDVETFIKLFIIISSAK